MCHRASSAARTSGGGSRSSSNGPPGASWAGRESGGEGKGGDGGGSGFQSCALPIFCRRACPCATAPRARRGRPEEAPDRRRTGRPGPRGQVGRAAGRGRGEMAGGVDFSRVLFRFFVDGLVHVPPRLERGADVRRRLPIVVERAARGLVD